MEYQGDAQVGGRLASVGQRLLDTSAKAIIRQSLEGLDAQIQAKIQPETTQQGDSLPPPAVQAPTQTQFAVGVAKNMLDDLLPPENRDEFLNKAILVVGALLLLALIDKWRINRLARKVAKILKK